ncbi:DUF2062 domain-containing protein, partial [Dissulfurirhabdus thermomarina]
MDHPDDTPPKPTPPPTRLAPTRFLRYYWLRLLRLQGDPCFLARGVAVGIAVALTPTIPFHTVLIVVLCGLLGGNLIAAVIASWLVSNPVTIPFQYLAAWKIGAVLTGARFDASEARLLAAAVESADVVTAASAFFHAGGTLIRCMMVGGVAMALPGGAVGYAGFLWVYRAYRRHRNRR